MGLFERGRKQLDQAVSYQNTFASEDGRKVLADLIKVNGVFSNSYDKDPCEHAYNAGKREAILRILTILQVDFDKAEKLLQEAKEIDNQYE